MTIFDAAYQKAKREKEQHTKELMSLSNVIGVGIGKKPGKGQGIYRWAIVVYVRKKIPAAQLEPKDVVPPEINGIPTDVVEVGEPVSYDAKSK